MVRRVFLITGLVLLFASPADGSRVETENAKTPPVLSTLATQIEPEPSAEPVETGTESPPTTSEFGTETEIIIALDDNGNIVPG